MEKKNVYNIILTFIITVGIFQVINLFIPVSLFKGFSVMMYSFSLLLILLSGGVGFSLYSNSSDYMYLVYYMITNILPIILILYTNIRYVNIIENDSIKLKRYNTLLTLSIVMYIIQLVIYHRSFHVDYGFDNMFLMNLLFSIIHMFISGLIWREISFYVTDG